MSTIILLRHGETVSNAEGRVQGQADSPLTVKGAEQARRYGRAVAGLIGDGRGWRVVSSPLGRCVQTSGLLCEVAGLDVSAIGFDHRLKEVNAGAFSGRLKTELMARHPELAGGKGRRHWAFCSPDGETHADLSARLAQWLAERQIGERLVVVSHGIAGKVLRGLYLGLDPDEAMAGDSPQDALYVLDGGRAERVACATETPPVR